MTEPVWIPKEVVLAVHQRQLAEHGGMMGVRDEGLLESALSKPQHIYHYDSPPVSLAALAAAYAYGIARNHPFLDGNKRTALVICRLFLRMNSSDVEATQDEKYHTFLELGAGRLSEDALRKWVEAHLRPIP